MATLDITPSGMEDEAPSQPSLLTPLSGPSIPTTHPTTDRLSIPFSLRLPLTTLTGSLVGLSLGLTQGGKLTALRFRAENAHRLPTSQVGWYLYHKSKNYNVALGGLKEGAKMGFRVGAWTGIFFLFEEAVDRFRGAAARRWWGFRERRREERSTRNSRYGAGQWDGVGNEDDVQVRALGVERVRSEKGVWVQRDFVSTVIASLGTAGLFSAWNRFPVETAARTATIGLKAGLCFGVLQDILGLMRGRRLGYVEFVRRGLFGEREEESSSSSGSFQRPA